MPHLLAKSYYLDVSDTFTSYLLLQIWSAVVYPVSTTIATTTRLPLVLVSLFHATKRAACAPDCVTPARSCRRDICLELEALFPSHDSGRWIFDS